MSRFQNMDEKISAYLDGEMTAAEQVVFEAEMDTSAALRDQMDRWAETDRLLVQSVPLPSGADLDALLAAGRAAAVTPGAPQATQPANLNWPLRQIAAMLAVFAIGGLSGYGLSSYQGQGAQPPIVIEAVAGATAAHRMFTAEARHAVEVPASETEHLQTWMSNRMGRDMRIPHLQPHGLSFLGGRMLPFGEEVAGQYMYENAAGARMTLYVTRADSEAQTELRFEQEGALTIARWQDGPWIFILIAPLAPQEFSPIAQEVVDTLI